MVNVMEVLEGKDPYIPSFSHDLAVQKDTYDQCIQEIKKIHDADIMSGVAPKHFWSDGTFYGTMSRQTCDYMNNLLIYLDKHTKHPEITIWRGIAVSIKHYELPLSQKRIPFIRTLMKKYNDYLTEFFHGQAAELYSRETKIAIVNQLQFG